MVRKTREQSGTSDHGSLGAGSGPGSLAGRRALKIAGIYAGCGLLWITLSDRILAGLIRDSNTLTRFQTYKGWGFILVTASLVFALSRIALRKTERLSLSVIESERQFRALFENLTVAALVIDPADGSILDANEAAAAFYGWSRDRLRSMSISQINTLPPDEIRTRLDEVRTRERGFFLFQHHRADGSVRDVEVYSGPIQLEGRTTLYSIIHDITERKRAEVESDEQDALVRQIMDTASVAIFLVDKTGRITHANRRMAEMFARPVQELIGSEYIGLVHPLDRDAGLSKMRALQAGEIESVDVERLYRRKDGIQFWGHLAGRRFHDVRGRELGLIGVITDIDTRRQAEQKLRESESKLSTILDNVGACIFIKDVQYRYTYANRKVSELFGVPAENIPGKRDDAFFSPASVEEIMRSDRPVIEQGNTVVREETELAVSGRLPRTYWTVKLPLRDSGGAIIGLCGISTDITERKQAEESLELLKYSIDVSSDAAFWTDREGRFTYVNAAACKSLGYTEKELLGMRIFDVNPESTPAKWSAAWSEFRKTSTIRLETIHRRKDGTVFPVEISSTFVTVGGHELICGFARDMSERKRMEAEIGLRSEILSQMAEGVNLVRGSDNTLIFTNAAFDRMFGYDPGELIGKHISTVNAPTGEDPAETVNEITKTLASEGRWLGELQNVKKDGSTFWCAATISSFEHRELGRVYISVHTDITERKRAAEELRQSEERFRAITMTASDAVLLMDDRGKIVHWNPAAERMFGYPAGETLGKDLHLFLAPERLLENFLRGFSNFVKTGQGPLIDRSVELVAVKKDRTEFPIEISVSAMNAGSRWHAVGIVRDITERKRAEQELRENRARLDLALQSAHMGVWRWEIKENRRYFDDLTCQLLGIAASTFTGTAEEFFARVHPDDRETVRAALARTIEQDALYEPAYRVVWPDGSVHFITSRGKLIRDDLGQPERINGILWDITEQRILEKERLKAQQLESLGTLAGGIAHDFNNLLQGVFGYISMARLSLGRKERAAAMLEQAEKALHQSVNLTTQLLTFSKGGKPVKRSILIGPVIENTARFALSGSRVDCRFDLARDLRPVEADEGQMAQVFQNIVLNAEQSMPLGGRIEIEARNAPASSPELPHGLKGRDHVRISVRDEGAGIPAEYLPRIFDPYFTTKEKGSGLGLASAYSIVRNHGGMITVSSEPGKGSIFSVFLPSSARDPEGPSPRSAPADAWRGRVLVMDDEEVVRKIAAELMRELGHDVETVEHGAAAIDAYREAKNSGRPFDVVILDLTVRGGMGGQETLRILREFDPAVKAVVSSGYSDDAVISDHLKYGFRSFLQKPYDISRLHEVLQALMT